MQKFSKWNKGYRYLLTIIDVFSKYGWILPLKDKKGETCTEAFKTIFTLDVAEISVASAIRVSKVSSL